MTAMQEEIFGPVLPIVSYESLDAVLTHISVRMTRRPERYSTERHRAAASLTT